MQPADIAFDSDGTPRSSTFDDVYFSQGEGLSETNYVFLEQNRLAERFNELADNQTFVVAETGFGTGLNFLATWQCFQRHAPENARLYFISCEKFSLTNSALRQAHQHFPELEPFATQLQHHYPPLLTGYHLLTFDRVSLLLMFSDAAEAYCGLSARVDAWFLDGFSPAKNPDMWQPELFQQISRLSHPQTTLATFTSARVVRDGLTGAGFKLDKHPGFGKKRDMLKGRFTGIFGPKLPHGWPDSTYQIPMHLDAKNVAVIGSGIVGATTASELSLAGFNVTVFDQHPQAAEGGSGNSQGAVYARLTASQTVTNEFYVTALLTAQHALATLPDSVPHEVCGIAQLANTEREQKRLNSIRESSFPKELAEPISHEDVSRLANTTIEQDALWFPKGGWASPKIWAKFLLEQSNAELIFSTKIVDLKRSNDHWLLTASNGKHYVFDQVIIAGAAESKAFQQTRHLPLRTMAGQITQLTDTKAQTLNTVLCTDRYIMPPLNGVTTLGSSFRVNSSNVEVTAEDHLKNITALKTQLPQFNISTAQIVDGRAAVRCATPDYLPMVGGLVDEQTFNERFQESLQKNLLKRQQPATHWPGLWINTGHGSKGLCSSHLCAKLLVAMMKGDPLPLPKHVLNALNPNRFLIRDLLRAKRKKAQPEKNS